MKILGINSIGNDHAIFLLDTERRDIFAISLERITRIKHDKSGVELIFSEYCDKLQDVDLVCFASEGDGETINVGKSLIFSLKNRMHIYKKFKPQYVKEEIELYKRINKSSLRVLGILSYFTFKKNKLMAKFYRGKGDHAAVKKYILDMLPSKGIKFDFYDHHYCHAASTYYSSQFCRDEDVLALTIDGFGDGYFSKVYRCSNLKMELLAGSKTIQIPGATTELTFFSLGALYGNFTQAMGLKVNSEEGKVEALAAYGDPYNSLFDELIKSVEIDGLSLIPGPNIQQFYDLDNLYSLRKLHGDEDFCAVIQKFLDDILVRYLKVIVKEYGFKKLCLAGGVAANVVTNLKIFESRLFEDIFIYPAMADDGTAAGAALLGAAANHSNCLDWIPNKVMPYWGDDISSYDVLSALEEFANEISFQHNPDWQDEAAKRLHNGEVGALVQGRMEFGPRALGNRSIIASPMTIGIRDRINSGIKRRPAYQPFCPSVMDEERARLFSSSQPNRHMTSAFRLKEEFKDIMPAAAHVDLTGRPQFCRFADNPGFHRLLMKFKELSGYGVLINTSFNKHGRTIVRTPNDALRDFLDCSLDFLVIDNFVVIKKYH